MERSALLTAPEGRKPVFKWLAAGVMLFMLLTPALDKLRSSLSHSGFYLSESLLFNSFWLLFLPLLFCQYHFAAKRTGLLFTTGMILLSVMLHVLLYPLLVTSLSSLFYYHTYQYKANLSYTLTEELYKIILAYTGFGLYARKVFINAAAVLPEEKKIQEIPPAAITQLTIVTGRKTMVIELADIFHIRASTPYVILHMADKQQLYSETLASLGDKMADAGFVRVHRSAIVNTRKVSSWRSRLNGDYDIILQNSDIVRLSRHYAATFKKAMQQLSTV